MEFDHFINYKTQHIGKELKRIAPDSVDLCFDNIGEDVTTAVFKNMKNFGRISACGSISGYNDAVQKVVPIQGPMVEKQLKMQGFQNVAYRNRWHESFSQNLTWIQEGKRKYKEAITEGFDNIFIAFTSMLNGENTGKTIVKA